MIASEQIAVEANRQVRPTEPSLLTAADVRRILDVSESTLMEWIADRRIACFRVGRVLRFQASELWDFIRRNTIQSRNGERGTRSGLHTAALDDEAWARIERLIEEQIKRKELNENHENHGAGGSHV